MDIYSPDPRRQIYSIVLLVASILSATCSLIHVSIIIRMKSLSGHMLLIYCMALGQLLYDVCMYAAWQNLPPMSLNMFTTICTIIGGLSTSMMTSIISIVLLYVIRNKKTIDVRKNFNYIIIIALLPGLIDSGVMLAGFHSENINVYLVDLAMVDINFGVRFACIVINVICISLAYAYTSRMKSKGVIKTSSESAICTLIYRMQFYPVVQAVSQFGAAWLLFGFPNSVVDDEASVTVQKFSAQCLAAIFTPCASIGYLVIFLITQPKGRAIFQSWFTCEQLTARPMQSFVSQLGKPSALDEGLDMSKVTASYADDSTKATSTSNARGTIATNPMAAARHGGAGDEQQSRAEEEEEVEEEVEGEEDQDRELERDLENGDADVDVRGSSLTGVINGTTRHNTHNWISDWRDDDELCEEINNCNNTNHISTRSSWLG